MSDSNPPPVSPVNNSLFTKTKERTPLNQVIPFKGSNMQRLIQVMQLVAQKSCRRACQLFCWPVEELCEKPACCPAQDQRPTQVQTTQVGLTRPPSTILILNISNSTLTDCVIGNNTYTSAVAESQPLMQDFALHRHDHMTCRCHGEQRAAEMSPSPSPPPACPLLSSQELPRIDIQGSYLNYVIIGDNNYMHAEHIHLTETEEPQM